MTSAARRALALALCMLPLSGCLGPEGGGEHCTAENGHVLYLRPDADREKIRALFQADGWIVHNASSFEPWQLAGRKTWNDTIGLTASIHRASGYSGTPDNRTNEIDHVAVWISLVQKSTSRETPIARASDLEASLLSELREIGLANDSTRTHAPPPMVRDWECIQGD